MFRPRALRFQRSTIVQLPPSFSSRLRAGGHPNPTTSGGDSGDNYSNRGGAGGPSVGGPSLSASSAAGSNLGSSSLRSVLSSSANAAAVLASAPVWNAEKNWCSLCKEPFANWNEHRGKRDHQCMEFVFDGVVAAYRAWWPGDVWRGLGVTVRGCGPRHGQHHNYSDGVAGLGDGAVTARYRTDAAIRAAAEAALPDYGAASLSSSPASAPMGASRRRMTPLSVEILNSLFHGSDRFEEQRRREICHMLKFLIDQRVVFLTPTQWKDPAVARMQMGLQGSLVMYKWQHPQLLRLFPHAKAHQISSFSQMCASMYNLETVFDLCGFKTFIVPQRDLPPGPGGEKPELTYAWKSFMIRNLFGQLRWAMEAPSGTPLPSQNIIAASSSTPIAIIAEVLGKALVTELIFCRVCEYVCRVEPVLREMVEAADNGLMTSIVGCVMLKHDRYFNLNGDLEGARQARRRERGGTAATSLRAAVGVGEAAATSPSRRVRASAAHARPFRPPEYVGAAEATAAADAANAAGITPRLSNGKFAHMVAGGHYFTLPSPSGTKDGGTSSVGSDAGRRNATTTSAVSRWVHAVDPGDVYRRLMRSREGGEK